MTEVMRRLNWAISRSPYTATTSSDSLSARRPGSSSDGPRSAGTRSSGSRSRWRWTCTTTRSWTGSRSCPTTRSSSRTFRRVSLVLVVFRIWNRRKNRVGGRLRTVVCFVRVRVCVPAFQLMSAYISVTRTTRPPNTTTASSPSDLRESTRRARRAWRSCGKLSSETRAQKRSWATSTVSRRGKRWHSKPVGTWTLICRRRNCRSLSTSSDDTGGMFSFQSCTRSMFYCNGNSKSNLCILDNLHKLYPNNCPTGASLIEINRTCLFYLYFSYDISREHHG